MTATLICETPGARKIRLDLASFLTPELRETVRVEAHRWIKSLRLVPYEGATLRERFRYRGDSLWWFTELYLHKMRVLEQAVSSVLALEQARQQVDASRWILETNNPVVGEVAAAFGRRHGTPATITLKTKRLKGSSWSSYAIGLTARLSRARLARRAAIPRRPAVAAFVHTAFWRRSADANDPGHESYIGPVLDALAKRLPSDDLFFVGVGPRRNFKARRWWDPLAAFAGPTPRLTPIERLAPREALRDALDLWRKRRKLARQLVEGDDIRSAGIFRDCDLWPILRRELESAALLQWPWSARAMDEAGAALDTLEPSVVVTYAEAGGWGRALMLEARRRGVRSVGIQHGFIFRHWLNYRHEPDEMRDLAGDGGFPVPDRTMVFDRVAADHLREAGHFPDSAISVTGNARLDDLVRRVSDFRAQGPSTIRRALDLRDGRPLVVLAAKYSEIREQWPALVAAAAAVPDIELVVKTHPAETPRVYEPVARNIPNVVVVPADADLAKLLAVADGLVTMNSTVAIDALVLGVPALVVGLPNNLSPFVEAGVMLGADAPENIQQGLQRLLYDREARQQLSEAAKAFVDRYNLQPTGRSADRAAEEILTLADAGT